MSLFLSPVVRALDADADPLPGAKWHFYTTGTTTPTAIYTTSARTTEHANPVVADAGGLFAPIYLNPDTTYRAVLKTAAGVTVQDIDPYVTGQGGGRVFIDLFSNAEVSPVAAGVNVVETGGWNSAGIGGGIYYYDSTLVAGDRTAHPNFIFSGGSGRYFRPAATVMDVMQAGFKADNSTDNAAKMTSLLAYLERFSVNQSFNLFYWGTPKVTFPAGKFYFSAGVDVKRTIWFVGQTAPLSLGYATLLRFATGGFVFNRYNTEAGAVESPTSTGADGSMVEHLALTSSQTRPVDASYAANARDGILTYCRIEVRNCAIYGFTRDGINIASGAVLSGVADANANRCKIQHVHSFANGRDGLHIDGVDSNACDVQGFDGDYNNNWAIWDSGYLGNSHVAHHCEYNGYAGNWYGAGGTFIQKSDTLSSVCSYTPAAWVTGAPIAAGQTRTNGGRLYKVVTAGGGNSTIGPTHTVGDVNGGDGYVWRYVSDNVSASRYYLNAYVTGADDATKATNRTARLAAASTTQPGADDTIWVWIGAGGAYVVNGVTAIPVWVSGMTWKFGGSYYGDCITPGTWLGCYEEGGQGMSTISAPSMIIGGTMDPNPNATAVDLDVNPEGVLRTRRGFVAQTLDVYGSDISAYFGAGLAGDVAMVVEHEVDFPAPNNFQLRRSGKDMIIVRADSINTPFLGFSLTNTTRTYGGSTARANVTEIYQLALGVSPDARIMTSGTAAPTTGSHEVGEIVWNRATVAGGTPGWVCTTAGTPGTWKAMASVAA